ncbi:ketoacyl-synt-domain-containing protein [Xylariaceae sp. AK1471]|nr:ketoacyl-synt-domain-containing protein [Xylariaceae sp. AK1471]
MPESLPSLMVFGPQTEFPPEKVLEDIRQELITSPWLFSLREAVNTLPQLWQDLIEFDPSLSQVPGAKLTFKGSSQRRGWGIQGFCVGFLSAVAVTSSANEIDLGPSAAVALRLAVCIGAYVDQDGACSSTTIEYKAIAVRWKEGSTDDEAEAYNIIRSISGAYISCINDNANVTVTIKADDIQELNLRARQAGLRTKPVHVFGRFHTPNHSHAVEKVLKLALLSKGLNFLDVKELQAPVRDAADGETIIGGSLTRLALENALVNLADWFATLKSSIQQLPKSNQTIAFVGSGNCIPASLIGDSTFQVLALGNLERPKPKLGKGVADDHFGGVNGIHSNHNAQDLSQYPPHSTAIVGMAGRFPGADTVDEIWDLIMEGRTTVEHAPVERLGLPQTGDYANTKWWGNFLKDPEAFDHKFFKKSSREALAWDPQQRILLKVVYEALESASYFGASAIPETLDYGCYLGPSLTIDTACSSSLVAVNTACRAIWSVECSRAIAGGTNVISSPFDYQNLSAAGSLSPSGQCKPFDADADGYRGEAVAVVVLKPLSDAIKDNDNILAVITGSSANQNHNFSHITAPHPDSQVDLYRKVMKLSGVEPQSVSYAEAHGTGILAIPLKFAVSGRLSAGLEEILLFIFGSLKGNIGHTEATAGVAGLIKVLLMMRNGKITALSKSQICQYQNPGV